MELNGRRAEPGLESAIVTSGEEPVKLRELKPRASELGARLRSTRVQWEEAPRRGEGWGRAQGPGRMAEVPAPWGPKASAHLLPPGCGMRTPTPTDCAPRARTGPRCTRAHTPPAPKHTLEPARARTRLLPAAQPRVQRTRGCWARRPHWNGGWAGPALRPRAPAGERLRPAWGGGSS